MRSLESRFVRFEQSRPELSTLSNFAAAVRWQGFSRDTVSRWFSRLVESDDFAKNDRKSILLEMYALTEAEEHENQGENRP